MVRILHRWFFHSSLLLVFNIKDNCFAFYYWCCYHSTSKLSMYQEYDTITSSQPVQLLMTKMLMLNLLNGWPNTNKECANHKTCLLAAWAKKWFVGTQGYSVRITYAMINYNERDFNDFELERINGVLVLKWMLQ